MKRRLWTLTGGFVLAGLLGGAVFAAAPGQEEWERVLQAAKKEGKVAIIGPTGADRRDALTIAFEKKYGITIEYHADSGAGILPRLSAERKADRYLWDVVITGTTTGLENLIPARVLDPLEANLVLAEVRDLKLWRNGALEFLDPGRQLLVMSPYQRGTLFVNSTLANAKEFKSYNDLLDPKWKGKIVADDPRKSGPGQATFTFFFLHPELGVKFIRAIAGQGLTLLRDYAQEVNMLGQGRYPVGLGLPDSLAEQRAKQGVPIEIVDIRQLKEGSDTSPASGGPVDLQSRAEPECREGLYQLATVQRRANPICARHGIYQQSSRCSHRSHISLARAAAGIDQNLYPGSDRQEGRSISDIDRSFRPLMAAKIDSLRSS
jgi:Bacterial extracellular solute-binding protein